MTDQQDAYERFIRPIEDQMIRSVWRIIRNSDDVDDAFQDALARIWKRWDRIQRHSNPRALILRICINAAYDSLRRKARDRKIEALEAVGEMISAGPSESPDPFAADERKAALCTAISRLPKNQGWPSICDLSKNCPMRRSPRPSVAAKCPRGSTFREPSASFR